MTQIIPSRWWGGGVGLYKYKWTVDYYEDLPTSWMKVWDTYNVVNAHTTDPEFPAGANLAWDWEKWDVLGWNFDLSEYQKKLVEWAGIDIDQDTNEISVEADVINWAAAWATAVQPWDDVSTLNNDAGYIDNTVSDLVNYTKTCDLANVALSGKYCDLSWTPTIWNWTLTVSRNWVQINTFTANQTSNSWVDIEVPTKTSDIQNDSGYIDKTVSNLENYTLSANLCTVATSGSYTDLSDKPTIWTWVLTIQKNWTDINTFNANATANVTANITVPTTVAELTDSSCYATKDSLCTVATSGKYCDLTGRPNLCAVATSWKYCDLTWTPALCAVATTGSYTDLSNTPDLCPVATSWDYSDLTWTPALCAVATTWSYNDLTDTPALCAVATTWAYSDLSWTPNLCAVATTWAYSDLSWTPNLCDVATSWQYCDLIWTPVIPTDNCELANGCWYAFDADLCTVAKTWSYTDLTNKPTIWTWVLTIQKNWTCVDTFSANATSNKCINITVPTDNCQLANSCGFIKWITCSDVTTALWYTPYNSTNPNWYTTCTGTLVASDLTPYAKSCDLCTVATTWAYSDLTWTPSLCAVATSWKYCDLTWTPVLCTVATSGCYSDLTGTPALCTVATSGSYNDLSNKPTIPSVINSLTSSCTWEALSAKQGCVLNTCVTGINDKIPSAATSSNQLADKAFVNSSINSVAAYYITKDANGDQFATYAELAAATTFYSGWVVRVPTQNDYTIVASDENHDNATTRYSYQWTQWEFQYVVNETALTQSQLDALNSWITSSKVSCYDWAVSTVNSLCAVATSGKYCDLTWTPTLCTVATSGKYCDLSWLPTIPTNNNQLTNGCWYTTCTWTLVASDLTPYAKSCDLKTVATSGKYCDLTWTPDLSVYQTTANMVCNLSWADDTHYPTAKAVADALSSAGQWDMLKSVYDPNNIWADAFDYCNFINTPTIPTDNCQLANSCGYITWINCSDVTTALGYTPYSSSNPNWYTTCTWTLVASDLTPYALDADVIKKTSSAWSQTVCTTAASCTTAFWLKSNSSSSSYLSFSTKCWWVWSYWVNSSKEPVFYNWSSYTLAYTSSIPTDNCQLANSCGYTTCTWTLVASDLTPYAKTCDLKAVATSWKYCDLTWTPTIPTNNNQLTNWCWYTTCTWTLVAWDLAPYAKSCDLCAIATSWLYCDLSWTPTIPTDNCQLSNSCGYITSSALTWYAKSCDLATVATSWKYCDLTWTPTLCTVATSGKYCDLTWAPTIWNATLTIQKNWINVNTFTANATSNVTANITVPTDTCELSNTAWFITIASVPTDNCQLSNGCGYTTCTGTLTQSAIDNTAFASSWDWDTTHAPSKNAVYDVLWDVETLLAAL